MCWCECARVYALVLRLRDRYFWLESMYKLKIYIDTENKRLLLYIKRKYRLKGHTVIAS